MIEQAMIFALGFLVAGLLALACLPAVWARAMRLTTRRLTQLVPLSMEEISAERDGLRAGFAVERRRLEQRLEEVEARRSDLMLRLGRRDVTVAGLKDAAALAAARIATLVGDLENTTRELYDVRCETGTAAVALHDLTGLADRQRRDVLAANERAQTLEGVVDQNRVSIASLDMRILGLDDRISDQDRALGNARAELARTEQAVIRAAAERDAALSREQALRTERDGLAADVARLAAAHADIQQGAAESQQAGAADRVTNAEMKVRLATLEAQGAMQVEAAVGAAARLRELMDERAAVTERSASVRPGTVETASLVASVPPTGDAGLDLLRAALIRVADDVLQLTERQTSREVPTPSSGDGLTAGLSLPT